METFNVGDVVEVTLSGDDRYLGIVKSCDRYLDDEQQLNILFLEKRAGTVIDYGRVYSLGSDRVKYLFSYSEYFDR